MYLALDNKCMRTIRCDRSIDEVYDVSVFDDNVSSILSNVQHADIIEYVFKSVYDYVVSNSLCGECYSISAVMHIIFKELGLPSMLFLGSCAFKDRMNKTFYHSWVALYGRIIDIGIIYQLNCDRVSEPILLSKQVFSMTVPALKYGVDMVGFDKTYFELRECSVSDCINNHTRFLWNLVYDILSNFKRECGIRDLIVKYSKEKRFICVNI